MMLRYYAILLMVCLLLTGGVLADVRPPNTPETQQIATFTSLHNVGLVTESDSIVWRQSNEVLDANVQAVPSDFQEVEMGEGDYIFNFDTGEFEYVGPGNGDYILIVDITQSPEPPLDTEEVQMVLSTREQTLADQGVTTYTKQSSIDTTWKTANMFNVQQQKIVSFIGSDSGRIISEESALVDAAGNSISTPDGLGYVCPFARAMMDECTPRFCNIVEMGSRLDMSEVQFTTEIDARTLANSDPSTQGDQGSEIVPIIDGPPTELGYGIRVTGVGQDSAAVGSAEAYMNAHIMEGRRACPFPSVDIVYNERTTATGFVGLFQKNMHYESGIRRT